MARKKKFNIYDYVDHVMCIHYIPNGRYEHLKNEMKFLGVDVTDAEKFTFVYSYDKDFPIYNAITNEYIKIYYRTCKERLPWSDNFDKHVFDVCMSHYKAFKIAQAKGWERVIIVEDDIHMLKDINKIQEIFDDIDFNNDLIVMDASAMHSLIFTPDVHGFKKKLFPFITAESKYFYSGYAHKAMNFYSAAFNIYNQNALKVYIDLWENLFIFSPDEYFALSLHEDLLDIGIARYPICQQGTEMKDNLVSRYFIEGLTNDNFRE